MSGKILRGGWVIGLMFLAFALLVGSAAADSAVDVFLTVQIQDTSTTTTTLPMVECIIDNKDDLSEKYFQVLYGDWRTNNGGTDRWDPADPTSDYRWTYSQTGPETARAEWVCTCLPAGEYEVFAWWLTTTSSMGQNVAYEVHHADGVTTVRQHQGLNGGQWNSLGTYTFDAGWHIVQIHNGEATPGKYVVADAVKFVSTGGTTSTTTTLETTTTTTEPTTTTTTSSTTTSSTSSTTTSSTSTTTTTTVPGAECIIDNKDSLTDRYFQTLSGNWRTNNGGTDRWDPADPASDYRWEYAQTGAETARAEWVCTSLPGGSYEVFAWWLVTTYSMGQNVAYEVHHADGVTTIRQHQGINGGQWNSLGTYTFNAGSHVVQIHNGEAKPGTYVVADAVKLVLAGGTTSTTTTLETTTTTTEPTTTTTSSTTTSSTSTTTTTTVPGTECIIDNKDSLTDRYFQTLSGNWRTNNGGTDRWDPADPASDYRWEYAQTGAETARARWVCTTLPAGEYEVFAWWLITTYSMGQNVAYEVHHAGGVTTVRKHQGISGGQWNSLGTYTFNAGSHVVQIHNGEAKPGTYVVADAVRFVNVTP